MLMILCLILLLMSLFIMPSSPSKTPIQSNLLLNYLFKSTLPVLQRQALMFYIMVLCFKTELICSGKFLIFFQQRLLKSLLALLFPVVITFSNPSGVFVVSVPLIGPSWSIKLVIVLMVVSKLKESTFGRHMLQLSFGISLLSNL